MVIANVYSNFTYCEDMIFTMEGKRYMELYNQKPLPEKFLNLMGILECELKPATGCTEPVAVALAVAVAAHHINGEAYKITVEIDKNVFKNGKNVGIPGGIGTGLELAAAIGYLKRYQPKDLNILSHITNNDMKYSNDIVSNGIINLVLRKDFNTLEIRAIVEGKDNTATCIIKDSHNNISQIIVDDKVVFNNQSSKEASVCLLSSLESYSFKDFYDFAKGVPIHLLEVVKDAMNMNNNFFNESLKNKDSFVEFQERLMGKIEDINDSTISLYVKSVTSIGVYLRMKGMLSPVMSLGGSGNQGLVATLPVVTVGKYKNVPEEDVIRALTLSYLVALYIKSKTGRLTPTCGCGVSAGAGASAGCAYLLDGEYESINNAVNMTLVSLFGLICDGAKKSCAFKVSTCVQSAVELAIMSLEGIKIEDHDGINLDKVEDSIANISMISKNGLKELDSSLVDVLNNISC